MMFLNFFIWGIWFYMGTYLIKGKIGADDVQTGLAFGTQCLGAIHSALYHWVDSG
jgi:hypothetical protein